jgi:glutathione-regulated potassium-efflux system ancillary protein KefF
MILIIHAHPYPGRSQAGRALLDAVRDLPGLEVRSLYDLYPDFDIDVDDERAALQRADLVVWLHPVYWYSVPGMLKHWFDVVLVRQLTVGVDDGLRGKHCLWVATTGGQLSSFSADGIHQLSFDQIEAPIRQTARFCGMTWEKPLTLFGADAYAEDECAAVAQVFRERLLPWSSQTVSERREAENAG